MIRRRLLIAAILVHSIAPTAQAAQIEHPDTAGMDPALAAQIESARALVEQSRDAGAATLAEAWGELGMLYQATGFENVSLAAYQRAAETDPFDGRWPYLKGIILGQRGETDDARRQFLESIALNPALAGPGWTRIGRLYLDAGRAEPGVRAFQRALEIDDGAPAALAGMGEARLALEQYEQAREFLESALEAEPRADRLHYPLAMALRGLGDPDGMQEHLSKAGQIGITPDDPVAEYLAAHAAGSRIHILRGRKAWSAGDVAGAADAFTRAVEADPASAVAWTNLGTAQAELGQLQSARKSLARALELEPGAERARENLVAVLRRNGQPQEALDTIDSAPGRTESVRWRLIESARIHFDLGDPDTAADQLLQALENERDLEIWSEALTALVEAERREEAYALATHEDLSDASDTVLAAWVDALVRAAEPESDDLSLAARLSERLYERNRAEQFAALHINTLLKRHARCREALAWISSQIARGDTAQALRAMLTQWSLELAGSPECGAPEARPRS
ncbi:tetratricopeptide repeat protein [Wenzhouxiangella sediminis]|uniref:tetratricopeptide repeat protein n=1 Tax=Wenzhouxiangella sediminis TaxID=1792836 RepID=UPI0015F282DE|nr:tetratricopeptide repeat protein [Wenzhouxiangella sediminis]